MRLKLLSSRVVIKKTIAEHIKSKAAREELLQFAIGNHQAACAIADADRFAVAALASGDSAVVAAGGAAAQTCDQRDRREAR
eukprot:4035948-Alexandrium_andersonii.AAC.1